MPDGPKSRTLSEQEFNTIRDAVVKAAPDGLDEAAFKRYIGPAMAQAIAEAEYSPEPVTGGSVGRFLSNAWAMVNPKTIAESAYQVVRHPVDTAVGAFEAMAGQQAQAKDASASFVRKLLTGEPGAAPEYARAAGHTMAGTVPMLGPAAAATGEKIASGDVAGGLGEMAGMVAPVGLAEALRRARVRVKPRQPANPVEADAVGFALENDIPIDAATATGNRFVRSAQGIVDNSPIGAGVAERAQAARADALRRVGGKLADDVYPQAVAPEQAGAAMQTAVRNQVGELHATATKEYGTLREIEAATLREVPKAPIAPEARASLQRNLGGRLPNDGVIREVRRIRAELDALGYQPGKLVQDALDDSATTYSRGHGGAPVYHDIVKMMDGTDVPSRGAVLESIDKMLNYGEVDARARGALEVAKMRRAGNFQDISRPYLPPDAADYAATELMPMPVKLVDVKKALKPIYERITRQLPITQQRASPGLKAIENIVNGPDYAPVSQVDLDLSAIKAISRTADLPELRDLSQGLAAQAVKQLDDAVRQATLEGGRPALDALETGRAATRAKYGTADILRQIREEPVQAFRQAVYSKDAGIDFLRKVQETAPAEMRKVGRAFVDDLLETAQQRGGFDRGASVYGKWKSLGPETRRILFGDSARELDRFFTLAERLADSPNPSRSGILVQAGAQAGLVFTNPTVGVPVVLGTGALAKVMHSPKAIRALNQGLTLAVGPAKASAAARASVFAQAVRAAREAGIDLRVAPAMGTEPTQTERPEGPSPR